MPASCGSGLTAADKALAFVQATLTPLRPARTVARPRPDPARRRAHGDLHVGLDRRSEGGGADAGERRLQRPGDRRPAPHLAGRRGPRRAAVLPLLRLHDHALDAAHARSRRRLPHRSARRAGGGPACPRAPRHAPDGHAHVPADLHAADARRGFLHARGVFGAAEKLPKEVCDAFEKKFGVRPSEAYGATELSPLVAANVPPSPARAGPARRTPARARSGRPILGCRAQDHRPRRGAGTARGRGGPALDRGPERDAGLSRPARPHRQGREGRLVLHRRHRQARRRRLHHDHRPREPVFQDRRRDGAASPDRGGSQRRTRRGGRRSARRRDGRARPRKGGAVDRVSPADAATSRGTSSAASPRAACRTSGFPRPTASPRSRRLPMLGSGQARPAEARRRWPKSGSPRRGRRDVRRSNRRRLRRRPRAVRRHAGRSVRAAVAPRPGSGDAPDRGHAHRTATAAGDPRCRRRRGSRPCRGRRRRRSRSPGRCSPSRHSGRRTCRISIGWRRGSTPTGDGRGGRPADRACGGLGVRGRSLWLDGRRWVPRGVAVHDGTDLRCAATPARSGP